jgi:hypothetical protein
MTIDGRKHAKKKYQGWFAIVLLTFVSDTYESRVIIQEYKQLFNNLARSVKIDFTLK